MANLTPAEKHCLEEIFEMKRGYVLDFSDRSLQAFFKDVIRVDIYEEKYSTQGTSKANRVRTFWQIEEDVKVAKVLNELLKMVELNGIPEGNKKFDLAKKIVERLGK